MLRRFIIECMVWSKNSKNNKNNKDRYKPSEIEPKWQKIWEEQDIYLTPKEVKKKKYILDMFPYPSGATLHVGHVEGYVGTDIVARYERMKGNQVLHPMGWDAFGLPAENYAIQTGTHPDKSTHDNIKTFKRQLSSVGLSYDWSREIDTSSPEFYKWTQGLFILMFKRGLAYKEKADVNWCPSCETVLANEQVINGQCERCGTEIEMKDLDQWFLKITEYADRLISGLDNIDWLEEVKAQQKNWIGRSEGARIQFSVLSSSVTDKPKTAKPDSENRKQKTDSWTVEVFTTRPDTLFGATFLVLSPEHSLIEAISNFQVPISNKKVEEVKKYVELAKKKTEQERIAEGREKTGVFSGLYAINPVNNDKIPVWIADYVLMGYGTGAIMAVPAHDARDFEFAKKYDLPIRQVIVPGEDYRKPLKQLEEAYDGPGGLVNSGDWDDYAVPEAIPKIIGWLEEKGAGKKEITYHLRDWLISRQRYWGVPIPMIRCSTCEKNGQGERRDMPGWWTAPEKDLPVLLPKDVDFRPTGESPIARSQSFQEKVTCPNCGSKAKREVDTMDTYVDSSWYFIRFVDNKNKNEFASSQDIKQWLPVDIYVGGGHVVQHLLFARFFWKVLFDAGLIDKSLGEEPFLKLRAPGWILGPDSRKMSKRWKNMVTPDDIIPKYGADTLRMYEMFIGPFETMKPWNLTGVEGMWRFVNKIWRLFDETKDLSEEEQEKQIDTLINRLIKKVGEDIEAMSFNTAISTMMETYNSLIELRRKGIKINWRSVWKKYLLVMAPFAPHATEELWERLMIKDEKLKNKENHKSIHFEPWPEYDEKYLVEDEVTIVVQVNGKRRGEIVVENKISNIKDKIEEKAREAVRIHLEGKEVKNVIYVPGRIINFVV